MFEILKIFTEIEFFYRAGNSLVLATARPLALVMVLPLVSQHNFTPGILRMAITLSLAIPAAPFIYAQMGAYPQTGMLTLALIYAKELMIGLLFMLPMALPFWAASAAGAYVEQMSGLGAAADGKEFGGAFSDFFIAILSIVFLANGWFQTLMLGPMYESYEIWPVFSLIPEFDASFGFYIVSTLDRVMKIALIMALPLLGTFLLIDVITGLAYKYTPQFNPMMESSGYKTLILTLLLLPFSLIMFKLADRHLVLGVHGLPELQRYITMIPMEPH